MIGSQLLFSLRRLNERLWVKPLGYAVLGVAAIFLAHIADGMGLESVVPHIDADTNEKLLTVISASMLGVATFAVASMVSAYASASSSATPRAFALVISDRVSQTALSSFVGAFIFGILGIVATKTGYYGVAGRFIIFLLTLTIFAWVVLTFVRWVDNIARLGRLGNTIEKVQGATEKALKQWSPSQSFGGALEKTNKLPGELIFSSKLGYVQHIDMGRLQEWAEKNDANVQVLTLPGSFVSRKRPLASISKFSGTSDDEGRFKDVVDAFVVGSTRTFSDDPRFGLIVLAEIASRALSPGINDPGTAIDIINRLAQIFANWDDAEKSMSDSKAPKFDRVQVPLLLAEDMMEDAFTPIARDGAGTIEVGVKLQKTFALLAQASDPGIRRAAILHARYAYQRCKDALKFPGDVKRTR